MSKLGKKASDDDDVEQLLRAAHDDVLLKLSLNSHAARGATAVAIDPDLDRRFQALKQPQKLPNRDDSVKKPPKEAAAASADADDLIARFAALKSSLPSNSTNIARDVMVEEEGEDEVEKVINWAIDAARLDPSPPSDDDDDRDRIESDDSSDDDDDDDEDKVGRGKRSKKKMIEYREEDDCN